MNGLTVVKPNATTTDRREEPRYGGEGNRQTLGDYFTLQRGTTYKGNLLGKPGPVLLGLATIQRNGGFRTDSLQTYGGESPDKLLVHPGELYLSLKDVTQSADLLGAVARVPIDHLPGRLTQDTVKLQPKATDVPLEYLYWLLRTPQYRSYCRAHATGTTNLGLARDDFLAFPAPEPTLDQRKIVETLGTLDDKIELNRRMNETLEAMARALFKSWFVDFDPVRAKAEGRDPGLPKPLADLFPDSFEDSALGDIPKGWSVERFADTVNIIGGGTPKTAVPDYWDGEIPWFSVVDAPNNSDVWVVDTAKKITREGIENSSTRILSVGTTIISARGTVGRVALVAVPMAMNQSCYGLRGKFGARGSFTYYTTRELVTRLQQHAHGSVFDTITQDTMAGVSLASPPAALIEIFETRAGPVLERIRASLFDSQTLAALRDSLLPRLISGELRVKAAERLMEAAI